MNLAQYELAVMAERALAALLVTIDGGDDLDTVRPRLALDHVTEWARCQPRPQAELVDALERMRGEELTVVELRDRCRSGIGRVAAECAP